MQKPSGVLGANVGATRHLRKMSQRDLAEAMTRLGHKWSDSTVSLVESDGRQVSVNELIGLVLVLGETHPRLLQTQSEVDVGPIEPLPPEVLQVLALGKGRLRVTWEGEKPKYFHQRVARDLAESWEMFEEMAKTWPR